jgi:hypothetical protein
LRRTCFSAVRVIRTRQCGLSKQRCKRNRLKLPKLNEAGPAKWTCGSLSTSIPDKMSGVGTAASFVGFVMFPFSLPYFPLPVCHNLRRIYGETPASTVYRYRSRRPCRARVYKMRQNFTAPSPTSHDETSAIDQISLFCFCDKPTCV